MAEGMNRATLIGHLGADPELKHTQSGQAVLRLRMATTESYVDKGGERQERTDWHNVVVWGKRAEGLNRCLHKGSRLLAEGSIQTRSWEDKDGGKRSTTEINAVKVLLLDGKPSSGARGDQAPADDGGGDYGADDVPFAPRGGVG